MGLFDIFKERKTSRDTSISREDKIREINKSLNHQKEISALSDKGLDYYNKGDLINAEKTFLAVLDGGGYTQPTFDRLIRIFKKRNDIENLRKLLDRPAIKHFPYMIKNIENIINGETLQQISEKIKILTQDKKFDEVILVFDNYLEIYEKKYKYDYHTLAFSKAKFLIKIKKNDAAWKLYMSLTQKAINNENFYDLSHISKEQANLLKKEKRFRDSLYNYVMSFLYKDIGSYLDGRKKDINSDWIKLKYIEDIIKKANLENCKSDILHIIETRYKNFNEKAFNDLKGELRDLIKTQQ